MFFLFVNSDVVMNSTKAKYRYRIRVPKQTLHED